MSKNFALKSLLLLITTATIILYVCGLLCWQVSFAMIAILFAVSKFEDWIAYTVYLSLFSCASPLFQYTFVLLVFSCAAKYFFDVKKNRKQFYATEFLFSMLIVLIWTANFRIINMQGFYQWRQITSIIFLVYFIYIYNKEINIKKCFYYMYFAIAISLVVGLIFTKNNYMISQIFFDTEKQRLQLFTSNPNSLAIYCSFGIVFLITMLMRQLKVQNWKNVFFSFKFVTGFVIIVIITLLGIFTLSKAFLIIFNFIIVYLILFLLKHFKFKSIPFVALILLLVYSIQFAFSNEFSKIIQRVLSSGGSETIYEFLNNFFTQRPSIWHAYIQDTLQSVVNLLFGVGLLSAPLEISPHSAYIYILHIFGLVGIMFLLILTMFYLKHSSKKPKLVWSNALMLIVFLFLGGVEVVLVERVFLLGVLSFLMILKDADDKKE